MDKIVKDCIYGHIAIPKLCLSFIDVPEFQRLRRVKQLGMVLYAYPSATHTRFEHSLGVMHLAGKVIDQLRLYVDISDRIKHLVQLAGLYHDIGHFAYSHLFDYFLDKTDTSELDNIFSLKHHEDRSIYFLKQVNNRLLLLTDIEIEFISACIQGTSIDNYPPYLFEIISDSLCGIDVDRQDYINRDANRCDFPAFQSNFIILNIIVTPDLHIGFKEKTKRDIQDYFDARKRMYENVYFHHTSKKIDKLYYCMMKRLGKKLFIYGEQTDDYNIDTLLRNSDETKELISCIDNRNLDHVCSMCMEFDTNKYNIKTEPITNVRFV